MWDSRYSDLELETTFTLFIFVRDAVKLSMATMQALFVLMEELFPNSGLTKTMS